MFFLAMPRGRTTPGFPPHLPIGSPSSFQSHGPRSGQTPTRANKPPRRRLLWARSGAAFRAAFGQGLGRSANAPSSKVRRPALALCAQKHRKPMSKARFSYLMRSASGYIVRARTPRAAVPQVGEVHTSGDQQAQENGFEGYDETKASCIDQQPAKRDGYVAPPAGQRLLQLQGECRG